MNRLLSLSLLATLAVASRSEATSITWTVEPSVTPNSRLRQIAVCGDGRIYGIDSTTTGLVSIRLLNTATPGLVASAGLSDSISCVGNVLFRFTFGLLLKNDGSPLGAPTQFVASIPSARRVTGGTVLALFIPVNTFARLDTDGSVWTSTDPASGTWRRVGEAGGAEQLVLGGGFLEYRLYAQNFDDSLWENVGQGCNAHWRMLSAGGAPVDRPSVRAIASDGINRLFVLDNAGVVHRGIINHERRDIVIDSSDFALLNLAVAGSGLRVHGSSAVFTPSSLLSSFGVSGATIPLTPATISTFLGNTTYTPSDIRLLSTGFSLVPSGRNVLVNAAFEEAGIELFTSNTLFPNLNISSLNGQVVLGGRVGACGQPEIFASSATFNGNFHGIDNFFSFVVDIMNGEIKSRVQAQMLEGVQGALADPANQVALQGLLLSAAQSETGGAPWSHIVGNTFTITGSTVRFSVER
jgi:hypothetical protein